MLTREWPPHVYGGAGVHVVNLVSALRSLAEVTVQCFGEPRADAIAHATPENLLGANPALQTLGVDIAMAAQDWHPDVAHSHTWYANLAGHLTALMLDIPHIITAHSLEPLRPWKADQLGGGYRVSRWVEQTTYEQAARIIAVSEGMRDDIVREYPRVDPSAIDVVHNGVDTRTYRPDSSQQALHTYGIDPARPYVLFVGRITHQKGILHLIHAAERFDADLQLVLCAAAPDTPEIGAQTAEAIAKLRDSRGAAHVVWIEEPVPQQALIQLFSHARVFACPSVYEPLGIVNLEAMACECAVVASAVGGIPEVVVDGVTGVLVPYDAAEPKAFEHAFADAINAVAGDPQRARAMGAAGRARAVAEFDWDAIARQTMAVYESAVRG